MIEFIQGNIFDSDTQALVNTVNTKGIMGKGLALKFRARFPDMYVKYRCYCLLEKLHPGEVFVWQNPKLYGRFILNLATKDDWRNPSEYEWIDKGLIELDKVMEFHNITSVSIPPLGCGCGNLDWPTVRSKIFEYHDRHWANIKVQVYEPLKVNMKYCSKGPQHFN